MQRKKKRGRVARVVRRIRLGGRRDIVIIRDGGVARFDRRKMKP